jgi:predicted RNA binding protein YcfA (HicA-like mRNA interferase family)
MPKLRVLSGGEVCRILTQNGFVEIRQKGSHILMQKKSRNTTITVPVPHHAELKIGTLLGIIRQSGLPKSLFETK